MVALGGSIGTSGSSDKRVKKSRSNLAGLRKPEYILLSKSHLSNQTTLGLTFLQSSKKHTKHLTMGHP